MWNELQDWVGKLRHRPSRRQRSSLCPRGRFEGLEARSMLSASYGDVESYAASASFDEIRSYGEVTSHGDVAAYGDIEALRSEFRLDERPTIHVVAIVMVSEVPPPLAAKFFANTNAAAGDAPWENLSWRGPRPGGNGPLAILGDTWEAPLAIKGQAPDGADGTAVDEAGGTDVGGTFGSGATNGLPDTLAAGGGNRVATFLPNNDRGNAFLQLTSGREHLQPPLPPASAMANYFSTQSLATTTENAFAAPFGSTAALRDSALDTYSADSLLLASDATGLDEERARGELSDEPDDEAGADEEDADGGHSLFDEAAQVALDALQRERRAIESVLEALSDIKIVDPEAAAAQTATYQHRESPRELALEDWRYDFGHATTAAPAYDTEGGMVLLENSGDANSNAYDLTAAFVADGAPRDVTARDGGPRQLDAALGVYQAIDVGASDLNRSARGEQSIAKPDVKAPASVSAENAPSKKSEQPSA